MAALGVRKRDDNMQDKNHLICKNVVEVAVRETAESAGVKSILQQYPKRGRGRDGSKYMFYRKCNLWRVCPF